MPDHGECTWELQQVWKEEFDYRPNIIKVGEVFRENKGHLITGAEDGVVRVHDVVLDDKKKVKSFRKEPSKLETKGGPIQALMLENVTNFNSVDILTGDSRGLLTLFTNGQILNRRSLLENSISSIDVERDSAGNMSILLGSLDGTLLAVSPYSTLWKHRLSDVLSKQQDALGCTLEITCIKTFRMFSPSSDVTYTAIADNRKRLHFFQNDTLVQTINVPSVVTCICKGYFVQNDTYSGSESTLGSPTRSSRPVNFRSEEQLALGTRSGMIYIISNFTLSPYASVGLRLSSIQTLRASSSDDADAVICSGHFNAALVFKNGTQVLKHVTVDWVHTLDIYNDIDSNRNPLIILGCMNSTIEMIRILN